MKLIQYFKGKIGSVGVLFLPETHSNSKKNQKGKGKLKIKSIFLTEKQTFILLLFRRRGWEGFIDSKLDAQDGNSILSLVKLIRFKETQDLCDKWGEKIRNLID